MKMATLELTKSLDSSEKYSNVDEFKFPTVNDLMWIESPENSWEDEIVKSWELFKSMLWLLRDAFWDNIPDDLTNKSVEIWYDTGNWMYNMLILYGDWIVVFENGCSYSINKIWDSWRSSWKKIRHNINLVDVVSSSQYYSEVELHGFWKKTFSGNVPAPTKIPQISSSVEHPKFDISVFNNCVDDIISNAVKCRVIVKDLKYPRFSDSMK